MVTLFLLITGRSKLFIPTVNRLPGKVRKYASVAAELFGQRSKNQEPAL